MHASHISWKTPGKNKKKSKNQNKTIEINLINHKSGAINKNLPPTLDQLFCHSYVPIYHIGKLKPFNIWLQISVNRCQQSPTRI